MTGLGNVLILGDSYSTFEGCVPEGHLCYYTLADEKQSGVLSAKDTWWGKLIEQTGSTLLHNDSFSGSTIGFTGYEGNDYTNISFNTRFENLSEQGMFKENRVDTLLVFGGTNDTWCGAPVGELKFEGWTKEDMYSALPATGRLFTRIQELLPDTKVYALLNTGLKPEIHEGIIEAALRCGATPIVLTEVDKVDGHPSEKGMTEIKDQILAFIEKEKTAAV